jgi:hypothetical protein
LLVARIGGRADIHDVGAAAPSVGWSARSAFEPLGCLVALASLSLVHAEGASATTIASSECQV